jgi:hypothetical protein
VSHVLQWHDPPTITSSKSLVVFGAGQQLPFVSSSHVIKHPLEIVVLDVWGPNPRAAALGCTGAPSPASSPIPLLAPPLLMPPLGSSLGKALAARRWRLPRAAIWCRGMALAVVVAPTLS